MSRSWFKQTKQRRGQLETVTVHEARTHLERLIEEVAEGAEIVISKNGVARAKLIPVRASRKLEFGVMKGKLRYPDNFNASLPHEVLALFKGRRPTR